MRAKTLERGSEGEHAKEAGHDDDGIEAGALPIAAAEVQPHAELIKGKREAEAVGHGAPPALAVADLEEKENSGDGAEKKDAVVEMVDMGLAHVEKEVGNHAAHDENHEEPRGDEGQQEGREDDARQGANMRSRN